MLAKSLGYLDGATYPPKEVRKGNDQHVQTESYTPAVAPGGDSVSEISRKTGVCRDTVYKYVGRDDFSERPPTRRGCASKLDPYKPVIDSWLDDDMRSGRGGSISTSTWTGRRARRRRTGPTSLTRSSWSGWRW